MKICWQSFLVIKIEIILHILLTNTINGYAIKQIFLKVDSMKELSVLDTRISYFNINNEDYISLTDMLKSKDGEFFISDWLRNRNTIQFLGI